MHEVVAIPVNAEAKDAAGKGIVEIGNVFRRENLDDELLSRYALESQPISSRRCTLSSCTHLRNVRPIPIRCKRRRFAL